MSHTLALIDPRAWNKVSGIHIWSDNIAKSVLQCRKQQLSTAAWVIRRPSSSVAWITWQPMASKMSLNMRCFFSNKYVLIYCKFCASFTVNINIISLPSSLVSHVLHSWVISVAIKYDNTFSILASHVALVVIAYLLKRYIKGPWYAM